jgi:hypothetical protein
MQNVVNFHSKVNVQSHLDAINKVIRDIKVDQSKRKDLQRAIANYWVVVGQHIRAIKLAEPNQWEALIKAHCGLSRSRAFELLGLADGTRTIEQIRNQANVRQTRRRQSVSHGLAAALREVKELQARLADIEAKHEREIAAYRAELAGLKNENTLKANYAKIRATLENNDKLMGEARAFTSHYAHHQEDIVSRIHRAKDASAETLKATPAVNTLVSKPTLKLQLDAFSKGMTAPTSPGVH